MLVVSHHLKLPKLDISLHSGCHPQRGSGLLSVDDFNAHDRDGDNKLSRGEFNDLLADAGMIERKQLQQHAQAALPAVAKATPQAQAQAQAQVQISTPKAPASDSTAVAVVDAGGSNGNEGCPELSKEVVASFARDQTIMLTVADWKIFGTFGINWMKHIKTLAIDYFLVGATDHQTAHFLGHSGAKHPCFKFWEEGAHKGPSEYKYGDAHYNAATWRKVVVVRTIVEWGFNVIHSDVDVVWFRDPLPYFLGPLLQKADMAVSADLISSKNPDGDEGLEISGGQHTNVNTGVYFIRASPGGRGIMRGWTELRKVMTHENDQIGIYRFIRERAQVLPNADRIIMLMPTPEEQAAGVTAPMALGMLSVGMMMNGYSYFIPRLHEAKKLSPLGIHFTWVPLSREGKFSRMRDGMLYADPPEYYAGPPEGYITADIEAPALPDGYNKWMETEDMVSFHLRAIESQLRQVYRVMAIALVLKRTLILPKMQCFCFKNWFMSEQCRIPGDKITQFPLVCALDQVFRPKVLYHHPPLASSKGPLNFTFREQSMLENPLTPADVISGQVVVTPEGTESAKADGMRVVTVPKMLRQDALAAALAPYKDARVLRLRHAMDLFAGWDDEVLKKSFEGFAWNITANWCCRDKPYIKKGLPGKVKMLIKW